MKDLRLGSLSSRSEYKKRKLRKRRKTLLSAVWAGCAPIRVASPDHGSPRARSAASVLGVERVPGKHLAGPERERAGCGRTLEGSFV